MSWSLYIRFVSKYACVCARAPVRACVSVTQQNRCLPKKLAVAELVKAA